MKRWTLIFKALSNINRLKIIKLLVKKRQLNVGEIAHEINISLNATSKHLIILSSLDILESEGKKGHVFYRLNPDLPQDLKKSTSLFIE
jgi:DNA-binding transcriptional ArsR family regulator